jgi:hypothetical protein
MFVHNFLPLRQFQGLEHFIHLVKNGLECLDYMVDLVDSLGDCC